MDSILETIKKLLGVSDFQDEFDTDLIIHINAALATLYQIGVGKRYFSIESKNDTWTDFCDDSAALELIKPYVYLKVKTVFDPPSGAAMEAINNRISEYEWRINNEVDFND